ncbi:MAG: hypothetical protein JRI68_32240 [Deltaproteobacteria bacterium]|nr:hypothetical protein [Deltaproteobacteria bacterium]
MQRRAVLKGVMVGGVVLSTPLAVQARQPPAAGLGGAAEPESPSTPPGLSSDPHAPWELVAPLVAGSTVGSGWQVAALSAVERGAVVLTLAHRSGQHAQVHLCRRGSEPRGIAHTADLDLVLMNGGDGKTPTGEGIGRAVKTVALQMAERQDGPTELLTHRARLHRFGAREIGA